MIDVTRLSDDDQWNTYVDRSDQTTAFHRHEFLEAIADATETRLSLLVGKNGEHPIGILPVFEATKGPLRLVVSPPPHAGIPHLGPAMMLDPNIKYRKATLRTKEFLEACTEWIDDECDPHYVRIVTNPRYDEVRPFRWDGFEVTPRFTYELDIDRAESELLSSFSRDARTSIRDDYDPALEVADGGEVVRADAVDGESGRAGGAGRDGAGERSGRANEAERDPEYAIERGGEAAVERLAAQLERRFAEQGESFPLSAAFLTRIYRDLPDETVTAYELTVDGRPVSGRLSLTFDDRLTFWQGVPKPARSVDLPINDLLNWHSIREARAAGCSVAELSGANVERLWDYKAKFNPSLATYYTVERTATGVGPLLSLYKRWRA
ncbi:GNAT family N-acetyltransferase [Halovivax limisalsi]|uniref:GNAT family N-acetyltransferase n=1 Tax=Halovivax limisalsi TaxID=1453760 RepID=UPI001FFD06D4|nr:GNAT family N-acetyltransferase [Halovivax limisalsi]